ncbi:unnamed protein product [Prorocentrum cordatum]|uniref:Exocyst complex component Sec6 n=1 Tax=Prorocentrum cordatum TaxID=2364126 RepID=A0ABN9UDT9_9DINO|nr:unnamed protein product [Polarella glacialis]
MSTAKATGSKRGRSSGVAAAAVESDDDGSRRSNSQASASEKEPGRGRGRNPKALKSDPKPRVKSTGRLRDCGRASCTAKETAQDRFPDGSEKHPSWPKFCNQLNQDKNLDEQFERCCKCSEDSRQKTFAEETVDIVNRSGFRMCSHFRVWNEDSLRDATSMPTDVEPKDLDLKISSIKFPIGMSALGRAARGAASTAGDPDSASKLGKATSGDDMDRIRQLEKECDIPSMLDGYRLGDREYAVRRFSPKMAIAVDRKKSLLELIEVASQMAASNLHAFRGKKDIFRQNLMELKKSSVDFQKCPKWCRALVSETLVDAELHDVWDIINPHADDDCKFDPIRPKLSAIEDKASVIMTHARDHALNYLLLPIISAGNQELDVARELRPILKDEVKKAAGTSIDGLKEFYENFQVCLVIIDTISEHSAEAPGAIEVDKTKFRQMLHGDCDKEWACFARALDQNDYWKFEKSEWRRASQGDLQEKDNIANTRSVLQAGVSDVKVFSTAVDYLLKWFTVCRSDTPTDALHDFCAACGRYLDTADLADDTENAKHMDDFNSFLKDLLRLDACFEKGQAHEGIVKIFAQQVQRFIERIREMQARVSRTVSSSKLLTAVSNVKNATDISSAMKPVIDSLKEADRYRFHNPEHVMIIFGGVDAIASDACNNIQMGTTAEVKSLNVEEVQTMINVASKLCDLVDGDDQQQSISSIDRSLNLLDSVMKVTFSLQEFWNMGGPAEQLANQEGSVAYNLLKNCVGNASEKVERMPDQTGAPKGNLISIAQIKDKFEFLLESASRALAAYEKADVDAIVEEAKAVQTKLLSIVSFGDSEKGWKAKVDPEAPWPDVEAALRKTVFSTKGLASKVASNTDSMKKAIQSVKDALNSYGMDPATTAIEDMEKTIALANTVRMEACTAQAIREHADSDKAAKTMAMTNVLDLFPEHGVQQNQLHRAMQQEIVEYMRG